MKKQTHQTLDQICREIARVVNALSEGRIYGNNTNLVAALKPWALADELNAIFCRVGDATYFGLPVKKEELITMQSQLKEFREKYCMAPLDHAISGLDAYIDAIGDQHTDNSMMGETKDKETIDRRIKELFDALP